MSRDIYFPIPAFVTGITRSIWVIHPFAEGEGLVASSDSIYAVVVTPPCATRRLLFSLELSYCMGGIAKAWQCLPDYIRTSTCVEDHVERNPCAFTRVNPRRRRLC